MPELQHHILVIAGHIDHGKTTLIQALTGVNCDRLPEEKARGITIDLGFAELQLGQHQIGIVDVPGHERYVRNMLAGATAAGLALLVVAADDGIMPQTREHLAILEQLPIQRGIIALTKADLVDETTLDYRRQELRELCAAGIFAEAPIIPTGRPLADSVPKILNAIQAACDLIRDRHHIQQQLPACLAVDRVFTVPGLGTVVTGTLTSGTIRVGDEFAAFPLEGESFTVRVRGIQNHSRTVDHAQTDQRVALNLAQVSIEAVPRGTILAQVGSRTLSTTLSVRVKVFQPRLRHRLPVRVHIGTAEVMGVVALFGPEPPNVGETLDFQLYLEQPIAATFGESIILRDSSSENTLAAGRVLQPTPAKLSRRTPQLAERLAMLASDSRIDRLSAAILWRGLAGASIPQLINETGVPAATLSDLLVTLEGQGTIVNVAKHVAGWVHREAIQQFADELASRLKNAHHESPLAQDFELVPLLPRRFQTVPPRVQSSLLELLTADDRFTISQRRIRLAKQYPKLTAAQQQELKQILECYERAQLGEVDLSKVPRRGNREALLAVAVGAGELVSLGAGLYVHSSAVASAVAALQSAWANSPSGLSMAQIRDALKTTRKFAIPLCESFDSRGITLRKGDIRLPGPRAQ